MNIAGKLLSFLFIARVLIPMHVTEYSNVVSFEPKSEQIIVLHLTNGKTVYVPTAWTIISEK